MTGTVRPTFLGGAAILYALAWMFSHRGTYAWLLAAFPGAFAWRDPSFSLFVLANAFVELAVPLGYLAGGSAILFFGTRTAKLLLWISTAGFAGVLLYYLLFLGVLAAHRSAWAILWGFAFKEIFHLLFMQAARRLA